MNKNAWEPEEISSDKIENSELDASKIKNTNLSDTVKSNKKQPKAQGLHEGANAAPETNPINKPSKLRFVLRAVQLFAAIGTLGFLAGAGPVQISKTNLLVLRTNSPFQ